MRICIVALQYVPDGGPAAPLFGMLCDQLVRRGHEITVICAVPHYPSGDVQQDFRWGFLQRSIENGIQVIRVRVPSVDRGSLPARLMQFVVFQTGAALASLFEKCDVVLGANPALEIFLPFAVLTRLRRRPAVFSVHDVYPDVGVTLGVFRHKPVIALVRALEAFCARRSGAIRILADSFTPGVLRLGVPASRLRLIYDWVDTSLIKPLPKENDFAMDHGLAEKFVVLYAGNIGLSQGLEDLLHVAACLVHDRRIVFLFVGEGAGKESLQQQAAFRELTNVRFLPFQHRMRLPEVLATADISLVVLKKGIGTGSLPSKTFSILASGRPILASVDPDSDVAHLLRKAGTGVCVAPGDIDSMVNAIVTLKEDPEARACLGEKGRRHALKYHSPEKAATAFEELFSEVLANGALQ